MRPKSTYKLNYTELKEKRKELNLSTNEFVWELPLTRQLIYLYEKGKINDVWGKKMVYINELCNKYGIDNSLVLNKNF